MHAQPSKDCKPTGSFFELMLLRGLMATSALGLHPRIRSSIHLKPPLPIQQCGPLLSFKRVPSGFGPSESGTRVPSRCARVSPTFRISARGYPTWCLSFPVWSATNRMGSHLGRCLARRNTLSEYSLNERINLETTPFLTSWVHAEKLSTNKPKKRDEVRPLTAPTQIDRLHEKQRSGFTTTPRTQPPQTVPKKPSEREEAAGYDLLMTFCASCRIP